MFILRKIDPKTGSQKNVFLGDGYSVIYKTDEKFKDVYLNYSVICRDKEVVDFLKEEEIFSFICGLKGGFFPVNFIDKHYIMTFDGNTFANVSCNF